jgi:hypothetical protein
MNDENKEIALFLKELKISGRDLLDYACGGSILVAGFLERYFTEIYFCDENLEPIEFINSYKFKNCKFDWSPILAQTAIRKEKLRKKIKETFLSKLPFVSNRKYDAITCFFCLETASTSQQEFTNNFASLYAHVRQNGYLIVGITQGCYSTIPGANGNGITELDLVEFQTHFKLNKIKVVNAKDGYGYSRMVFMAIQK